MNFKNEVALRYLFSVKGTNFINIISGVTILGLSIGTTALILVLSVFNGFEELIASMINQFNPPLKITPVAGKYFEEDETLIKKISQIPGVKAVSRIIEETAAFEYQQANNAGTLMGVDSWFNTVTMIDSTMVEGEFLLETEDYVCAVLGSGMARNLSVDVLNAFENLSIHMPDRKAGAGALNPFKTRITRPVGVFSVQQEIDNAIVLVPLSFAQNLLGRVDQVSSLGIGLTDEAQVDKVQESIQSMMGDQFRIQNRYQQDEDFLKLMNIEKWMAFLIACLMILLITFNLIGCLWMIILDKRKDISILRALGSTATVIRKIFLRLGLYYTLSGLVIGLFLAVLLYVLQKQFGLITIPQGFVVDSYPIRMKFSDVLVVTGAVLLIGFTATWPVAVRASRLEIPIRS